MPNLFGISETAARNSIQSLGLTVGDVLYVTQSDLPPGVNIEAVGIGEVFFQSPAPGVTVPAGTPISIAVRLE